MLFDITKKKKNELNHISQNCNSVRYVSSQDEYLKKNLPKYERNSTCIHYTSNGRFALDDLVIHYARAISPAHVIISSFNISLTAARKLIRAHDCGILASSAFILNSQKAYSFRAGVNMLNGRFPLTLTRIHAKVAILNNGDDYITIVTSGNLSSNNNIERGTIHFDRDTYKFDYTWMIQLLNYTAQS